MCTIEQLLFRGLEKFMKLDDVLRERRAALESKGLQMAEDRLPLEYAENLRGILFHHVNAFRRALSRDPLAKVWSIKVQLKPGGQAVEARPLRCGPTKDKQVAGCSAASNALGLVVVNIQADWASSAIFVPSHDSFRLVSDNQAVDSQIEQPPGVMNLYNVQMGDLLGARCFGKLDLLLG